MARLSTELHDYMRFRAAMEGQGYDLEPGFFGAALLKGVRSFFGIEVNDSGIVSDTQQPEVLKQYWAEHAVVWVDDGNHMEILSATDRDVMLRAQAAVSGPDGDSEDCVLRMSRASFHEVIDAWLDHKAAYNKRWNGEFCGVGPIHFECTTDPEGSFYLSNDKGEPQPCRSFNAQKFDVDMEHG
jgi:hypothetical protein